MARIRGILALLALGFASLSLLADGGSPHRSDISLVLRYGASERLPIRRVPGSTTLNLPIAPGSRLTHGGFPEGIITSFPGTPYVRIGKSAAYTVHESPTQFMAWVREVFHRQADHVVTDGTVGNLDTGVSEQSLSFSHSSQSSLVISVTLYSPHPGTTRYAYWGTDIVNPPRPKWTKIGFAPIGLTGTITTDGVQQTIISHNRSALKQLAEKINTMHTLWFGFCPSVTRFATLTFHGAHAQSMHVKIASGCSVSIGAVAFQDDPAAPLWAALQQAIEGGS